MHGRISGLVVGDVAIDTGHYGTDMTRHNKLLVVAARQKDGHAKITHDASLATTKEAREGAAQRPN